MINIDEIGKAFSDRFGHVPELIAQAPGRVNLIGEHTDYNGGFVLPVAIEHRIYMAVSTAGDNVLRFYSMNFQEEYRTIIKDQPLRKAVSVDWANYCIAVIEELRQTGIKIPGLEVVIQGNIPIGRGLSSSAALEICTGVSLRELLDLNIPDKELALLCQRAEHSEYVGVECGVMDQFASLLAQKERALFLDCYTLEYKTVPFPVEQAEIIIFDSGVKRELVETEYNQRREQCAEGLRLVRLALKKDIPTLRHCSPEEFESIQSLIPEPVRSRVRHVITENQRVLDSVRALEQGDMNAFGQSLNESHASLQKDYEVSCEELDTIVETAQESKYVFGARLTGAGFGGSAIAIAQPESVNEVINKVSKVYEGRYNRVLRYELTKPAPPASVLHYSIR